MDDFVDQLKAETHNAQALLLEILTSGYEEWDYIFATEGNTDRSFYFDFINSALEGKTFYIMDCGGKYSLLQFKKVVDIYPWVNSPKFRYLCDKDFDDYLQLSHEGVWKTNFYSIESYFAQKGYIGYSINKYAKKQMTKIQLESLLSEYDRIFQSMALGAKVVCAAFCKIRENGEHPRFDDFGIDQLFDFSNGSFKRRKNLIKRLNDLFQLKTKLSTGDVLSKARLFDSNNALLWLRGKLAFQIARKSFSIAVGNSSISIQQKSPSSNVF
ncbi:DUF4435 domain-containing protein [Blastomonas sp. CACIA14H2]|uniref:DUF4435 domain-containing protein n=1 Tax=Blastomonas sp. CACIA14H2 TaxID=1419876 RepID=UPI00268FB200